jgi:hypothetical protein
VGRHDRVAANSKRLATGEGRWSTGERTDSLAELAAGFGDTAENAPAFDNNRLPTLIGRRQLETTDDMR